MYVNKGIEKWGTSFNFIHSYSFIQQGRASTPPFPFGRRTDAVTVRTPDKWMAVRRIASIILWGHVS